jgi:hypothetical protein
MKLRKSIIVLFIFGILIITNFLGTLSNVSGSITTLPGYEAELFATVTSGGHLQFGLQQIDEAPNGTLFVGQDFYDGYSQIYAISPNRSWTLFGNPPVPDPDAVTVNSAGTVFTGGDGYIYKITPSGASSQLTVREFFPDGPDRLEVSPNDTLYAIWLSSGHFITMDIYEVSSLGAVSFLTDGNSITFDGSGNMYILRNETVYLRSPSGSEVSVLTGVLGEEIEYHPSGFFVTVGVGVVYLSPMNGSGTVTLASGFALATDVTVASSGDIFVTDRFDVYRIYLIEKNEPPVADAGNDKIVNKGDLVEFDGSASYDPDGTIVTYEWDFNLSDGLWWETGAPPDAFGPNPTHNYDEYGVYNVTLRVTDNNRSMDSDTCEITVQVPPPLVPIIYLNVSVDGYDVILNWDPISTLGIDHYSIYRSTSQTGFDFNTVWVNTSSDNESGEPSPIPLRTIWNDTNAALPGDPNYEEEYYYIVRAVNVVGEISGTSRTVGKWTKSFSGGVSTFSLPLEPLEIMNTTADNYLKDMNARYIKWMDPINHIWMKHGDGSVNDTQMEVGKGYEIAFDSLTNYTFIGMPAAMILYDNLSFGFDAALITGNADSLTAAVDPVSGDVNLTWDAAAGIDTYYLYNSSRRDGFWGTLGIDYHLLATRPLGGESYTHGAAALAETEQYYMVVPFISSTGERGIASYSIGVWTAGYLDQYDTFALPLKPGSSKSADWFCDNIPDTVGMNYYIYSAQRWGWHSTIMPEGAFDPILEMAEGYQISTTSATKFSFIGV